MGYLFFVNIIVFYGYAEAILQFNSIACRCGFNRDFYALS